MNAYLILFILTLVYQIHGKPNDGWGQGNQWGGNGGRPGNQWGGGRPEQQWGNGPNNWQPNPEPECSVIPKNAKTLAITPLVKTEVLWNSVYLCESESSIQQISYTLTTESEVTCNGVVVFTDDYPYNITFIDRNGNRKQEEVILTNYTLITTFSNGNYDYLECGIISNGRCAGDEWTGISINQADDQTGCCKKGIRGGQALVRKIQVTGRCSSKCSLGRSTASYANAINDKGFADRASVGEQAKETKSNELN